MTSPAKDGGWDAVVEEVELDALLAAPRITLDGWLGPPWLKEGWFHAWLLDAGAIGSEPRSGRRTSSTGDWSPAPPPVPPRRWSSSASWSPRSRAGASGWWPGIR